MVYIDPGQLKWLPYVKSWLNKLSDTLVAQEYKEQILELFSSLVSKCFHFVKRNCTSAIAQVIEPYILYEMFSMKGYYIVNSQSVVHLQMTIYRILIIR